MLYVISLTFMYSKALPKTNDLHRLLKYYRSYYNLRMKIACVKQTTVFT